MTTAIDYNSFILRCHETIIIDDKSKIHFCNKESGSTTKIVNFIWNGGFVGIINEKAGIVHKKTSAPYTEYAIAYHPDTIFSSCVTGLTKTEFLSAIFNDRNVHLIGFRTWCLFNLTGD